MDQTETPEPRTCRECGTALHGRKRTWCGHACKMKRYMRTYFTTPERMFKRRARELANYHLTEPQPCIICGGTDRIQRHHPRYDQPLVIEWRCFACHREAHRVAA